MNATGALAIHYVASVRIPSERANAYQILVQCDALAAAGHHVTLVAPKRANSFALRDADIAAHYGLRAAPRLVRLFTLDWIDAVPPRFQRVPFLIQSATFAFSVKRWLARHPADVVYTRDQYSLALLARSGVPLVYEAHDLPRNPTARRALVRALGASLGIIAITHGLADDLAELGVERSRIEVLPDGFDPRRFAAMPTRADARSRLGIAQDARLVVYAGQFFAWKGVDTLVDAAARAPSLSVLLVGGRPDDRARIEARVRSTGAAHVRLHPPVEPSMVPQFLAAADVLVIPNSAKEPISARYTSPLKLFEALAAGRAVVASDLPSLREVLHEDNAVLVRPDDPEALARGLERAMQDVEGSSRRAERGRQDVQQWTWDARAVAIAAHARRWLAASRDTRGVGR